MKHTFYVFLIYILMNPIILSSQSKDVIVKAKMNAFVLSEPSYISKTICGFKNGEEIKVVEYIGKGFWKVRTRKCEGHVNEDTFESNDGVIKLKVKRLDLIKVKREEKNKEVEVKGEINKVSDTKKKYKSVRTRLSTSKKITAKQCTGRTQKGRRCKRMTTSSSGRCYQH